MLLYSEWLYSRSSYIFSSSYGAFTKSNHIMGHRVHLKELEELKKKSKYILTSKWIKLGIKNSKIAGKLQNFLNWSVVYHREGIGYPLQYC